MAMRGTRLRATALLTVCAFAVHQLRYLLAYGERSGEQLGRQGHSYLGTLGPVIVAIVVVALIEFGLRLVRVPSHGTSHPLPSGSRLWGLASGFLLALFTIQESLEGLLVADHHAGLEGLFGSRGWLVFALAVVFGGLAAFLLRGAAAVERSRARRRGPSRAHAPFIALPPGRVPRPSSDPLARFLAGRGPPPIATA